MENTIENIHLIKPFRKRPFCYYKKLFNLMSQRFWVNQTHRPVVRRY
jgi:hypothetical protein